MNAEEFREQLTRNGTISVLGVTTADPLGVAVRAYQLGRESVTYGAWCARVILFKPSGKYYTAEPWRIPEGTVGPFDMDRSPDSRRIDGGPVLVESQEPWGFPHLFPEVAP